MIQFFLQFLKAILAVVLIIVQITATIVTGHPAFDVFVWRWDAYKNSKNMDELQVDLSDVSLTDAIAPTQQPQVPTATPVPTQEAQTPTLIPMENLVAGETVYEYIGDNTYSAGNWLGLEYLLDKFNGSSTSVNIVLANDIQTPQYEYLPVRSNIHLIVPEEHTLTLDAAFMEVNGTLTSANANIKATTYGYVEIYVGGAWIRGDVNYSVSSPYTNVSPYCYVFSVNQGYNVEAYNYSEVDLYINTSEDVSVEELNIYVHALSRTKTYFNGKCYEWDGYNITREVKNTPTQTSPWRLSDKVSVDNADDLRLALSYLSAYGEITLTSDVTLSDIPAIMDGKMVSSNTKLIIAPGVKLTIIGAFDVYGTLESDEDGVVISGREGWIWLNDYGTWKRGNITFHTDISDGRHAAAYDAAKDGDTYAATFGFEDYGAGIQLRAGWFTNLYIDDPTNNFIIRTDGLSKGARIYVNDELVVER